MKVKTSADMNGRILVKWFVTYCVDIESFWMEGYAGQTPNSGHELSQQDLQIRATVKRMYGNESLPTLGN